MLLVKRQEAIIDILNKTKSASFKKLSDELNVSISTIRRDVLELEKQYPISITRGGAVYTENKRASGTGFNNDADDSNTEYEISLANIGSKAINLINDGDTIIIDGGFTSYQLAEAIKNSPDDLRISVITTSLDVAYALKDKIPSMNLIITGGEFRGKYRSLTGLLAEDAIKKIKVNKAFISVSGITEEGFYTSMMSEVTLRQCVCNISEQIIIMAHDKKFSNNSGFFVAPLEKINKIITNNKVEPWDEICKNHGIELIY